MAFDIFGRGLATAATGAQTGAIKGEAEAYRRQQADLLNQYKLQALQAHQKAGKDPNEATRKLAGAYALQLSKTRDDLENQGFFKDHPELRQPYDDKIAYSFGVASGSLPAENYDPVHYGQVTQHAADIADNYVSPYGGIVKAPNGQAVLPGEEPYAIGSATGPYAPSNAPPLTGTVVTPPSLLDTSKLPVTSYQTPKQAASATTAAAAKQNADTNTAVSGSRIPLLNAQTAAVNAKQPYVAKKEEATIANLRAGAGQKKEATRASQVLTPVKKATAESQNTRREAQTAGENRRMTETERHNKVQEQIAKNNSNIADARQKDTKSLHDAVRKATQFRMDNFPQSERGKNLRARLAAVSRETTAAIQIGPIKTSKAGSAGEESWQRQTDILRQIDEEDARLAKQKTPKGSLSNIPAPSAPGAKLPAGLTQDEVDHVEGIMNSGTFKPWVAGLNPKMQAKANMAFNYLHSRRRAALHAGK